MASARTVYHVLPNDEYGWKAQKVGTGEIIIEGEVKEEIVENIKNKARSEEPSQVVVHGMDGTIQYERTYGDDPVKYKN